MRPRWTALLAVSFVLFAACHREAPAIEEAKKRRAGGELDSALTLLQTVHAVSPGSADDAEASRLATTWLLEAAEHASSREERRRRLEAAIGWSPTSGEAAARLCAVLADLEQDEEAEKCLADLGSKKGVPDAVVRDTSAKLAARKEQAEAAERATLLESGRPAQLRSLMERWPSSPEATQAKERLARAESLCADQTYTDELRAMLARLDKLADEAAAARKTPIAPRLDAFERLGKDATALGGTLKNKGIDAEAHAAKPNEERLKKTLHDGFWALADLASDLGEGLKKAPAESDESYDEHASRMLATWEQTVRKAIDNLRKGLDEAAAECRVP